MVRAVLDPEAQALLEVIEAAGMEPLHTLSVDQARERMRVALRTRGEPLALDRVEDVLVPAPWGSLCLRLYRPVPGELPLALFMHGGGWTINDLDTHDELCRRLARRSRWLIASVDYRRAPEHKHPAALEDAYHGYLWSLRNAERIGCHPAVRAVVGESSGATTAAALTMMLRDGGAPMPIMQALAYPMTDVPGRWPSHLERGTGYTLDRDLVEWFMGHCVAPGHDETDGYLYPLHAANLSGLPPTFIMTAEFDPLRDEGVAFATKLAEAGNAVTHLHASDQMHGFLLLGKALRRPSELIDRLGDALGERFGEANRR
ncbi:MAG: alpha/beta hydrolase [Solirubrobacteraceae bacterium]